MEREFLGRRPGLLVLVLAMMFLFAAVIRLYNIQAPGILVEREFTSAIFARYYYFQRTPGIETWRMEEVSLQKNEQPVLEPPVTEYLVSWMYTVIGAEDFTSARFLTTAFWLAGGLFFYLALKRVLSSHAALIGTAFYLFAPLGVLTSRSFQPDALMMMLFMASLYAILGDYDKPSLNRFFIAAALSGLTLLIRPIAVFTLLGAYLALAMHKKGTWRGVFDQRIGLFLLLALSLPAVYYGYSLFFSRVMHWKLASSFRPSLYFHREYWEGWLLLAVKVAGLGVLISALLGMPALPKGRARYLLTGLWAGYFIFGLAFTFHIHTHGYYHIQLIPILAIPLGVMGAFLLDWLWRLKDADHWHIWLPVAAALALVLAFSVRDVREGLHRQVFESRVVAERIGDIVHHSQKTVLLAYHYGLPLQYFGELSGDYWQRSISYWLYRLPGERELSVDERLDTLGYNPEYFIITDFEEYRKNHTDLKEYLLGQCKLIASTEQYLIYGRCTS